MNRIILMCGLLLITCVDSVRAQTVESPNGPLAVVNSMPITIAEFEEAYVRAVLKDPLPHDQKLREEVLERLIADKLLYAEGLRQGLDKDPQIQRMIINTLLRKDVYGDLNLEINDEELEEYFKAHATDFVIPQKVQLNRILIRVDSKKSEESARQEAEQLLARIKRDPDKFGDEAMRHSDDSHAKRRGDVGFISREGQPGLDPKVVEIAFGLTPGTVSPTFRTEEGYNIVQVVNVREKIERSYEEVKGAVYRKYKTELGKTSHERYIKQLSQGASIQRDLEQLRQLKLAPLAPPSTPPAGARDSQNGSGE